MELIAMQHTPFAPGPIRSAHLLAGLAFATLLPACAGVGPQPPLPISEVVSLSKADSPPSQVVARLDATRTTYAPRGSDFGKLADMGVKPEVLDSIQARFVGDVELLTRYYALGESLGGCTYCFPQPLDLANLAAGGNGMAALHPTGRYTGGGRPPGVPDWVPASPGIAFNGPGITVPEVVSQSKAGVPAEELARKIRRTRLDGVIAQGGLGTISTRSSVGLTGSQLAALHAQGVLDPVLDALQEQYLAQFIEYQRQRYQNRGKGPEPM
jgi:hypothetical protein